MIKEKVKKTIFMIVRKLGRIIFRKHIWLVSDRQNQAGDNGEAFFYYLQDKPIHSVFAISSTTSDYERISRIGKVIDYDSWKYKFLLCVADVHISSQVLHMENHEETPQIFLQHGLTQNDISSFINPCSHKNFYMITSANREYQSLIQPPYIMRENNVWLTGMPRYDSLKNKSERKITISFTWRKQLAGVDNNTFLKSDYYKNYKALLTNDKFKIALQKYKYKLYLKLHPEMERFMEVFEIPEYVTVWNSTYQDIFSQSDLLITDYSSIAFDFAQLKKATVYYQFDRAIFWNGEHNYTKGYFEYEKDGFGPVIDEVEALIDKVILYMQTDCKLEIEYENRINEFFTYTDRNNSERIYNKIIDILN